jgi:hypothetical protein
LPCEEAIPSISAFFRTGPYSEDLNIAGGSNQFAKIVTISKTLAAAPV